MSVPRGSYVASVERFFVESSGRGLMLSARDEALVESWHSAGYPLRAVLRGIETGLEAATRQRNALPRSLRYFTPFVEDAVEERAARHLSETSKATATAGTTVIERLVATLQDALAALSSDDAEMLGPFITRLESIAEDALWETLPELDRCIAEAFVSRLPGSERRRIDAAIDAQAHEERWADTGEDAQRIARTTALAAAIRAHFELPELVSVALAG